MLVLPNGIHHIPAYFNRATQENLRDQIREIISDAPLFTPRMPRTGKAFSVKMSNCGSLGWVSDQEKGYRYQKAHPLTGQAWPEIPSSLLKVWEELANYPSAPEACLINFYKPDAKMGLHQDRDEQALDAPVISISLGDSCRFKVGGTDRKQGTTSLTLKSGDVIIMSGKSRLCFHGVDRIFPDTSTLLAKGGRLNLTLRRVTIPS